MNGSEEDFAELEASIVRMKALDAPSDQEAFIEENRVFHGDHRARERQQGARDFLATRSASSRTASITASAIPSATRRTSSKRTSASSTRAARATAGAAAAAMESHVTELENLVRERYQHLLNAPDQRRPSGRR